MQGVRQALLLSTGERYFTLLANFATIAFVSRILTPEEIGVSVVGMAILGIALSAREFASAGFLIQSPVLNSEDIRGAFSVILVLTVAISAALISLSPILATYYDDERLVPYLRLISVCLILDLASLQVTALLRREMAFGKVAAINVLGAAIGSVVTVALALKGFSYMSFAWAWLACSIGTSLLALFFRPHFWMFKPSVRRWRGMIVFGGYNGAIASLYRIYESAPLLIIGRVLSPDAAALYSRSLMVCQIPDKLVLSGAVSVLFSAFSAAAREGGDLKQPYLNGLRMITVFHWPALLVLAVLARPAVDILLGHQWDGIVPLVQVIAIASLFSFSFELNYPVMVAIGAIKDLFIRSLIIFPVSAAVIVTSVILGGLSAAAWSMLIIIPFQATVSLTFVRKRLGIRWAEIAAAVWRSGIVAVLSALGPLVIVSGFGQELTLVYTALAVILAAAGWLGGLLLTRHPLLNEIPGFVPVLRRPAVSQTE